MLDASKFLDIRISAALRFSSDLIFKKVIILSGKENKCKESFSNTPIFPI